MTSRVVGPGGYEYTAYPIKRCDRCKRDTPHSTNGRCMELHRSKPLSSMSLRRRGGWDRWTATKTAVFNRDDWRCQRCGIQPRLGLLDAHHRCIRGAGGHVSDEQMYGLAGLISLCRYGCHSFVHENREDAERLGFVVPRFPGDDPESVPVLTIHGWVYLLAGGSRVAAEPGGAG